MRPGDVFADRFELMTVAGGGGMGVVWHARDRVTGVDVALKLMLRAESEETVRFAREAKVLRALTHPRIVRYVADGVTWEREPWLAMEWLEGEDLGVRLRRGPLDGRATIAVSRCIAEALSYAHGEQLVHRDLKPSNVWLVDGDPTQAKLLDFGVVRRLDPGASAGGTRAGVLVGTPSYMAPEQARGDGHADARADIHALGSLIFRCLTGRPAFVGEHLMALLGKLLLEEAPRLSAFVSVPAELDELVARMLAKEPSSRPASADEVRRVLDALGDFEVAPGVASHAALARERKWLCVLAVDTAPAEDRMATNGSSYSNLVAGVAVESGARLERLLGGAQILVWETTGPPTELASRAARAALALRSATDGIPLALASGRAEVEGVVAVGEALERAAERVKRSHGQVVLDDSVAALLERGFELSRQGGDVTLEAERNDEGRVRTLLGRETPCVGREVELSTLDATLAEVASEEAAAVVVVVGDTGLGKSRLRYEWIRRAKAARPDLRVWQAQADAMRGDVALGIAAELVRDACGVPFGATGEVVRERVNAAVARVAATEERTRIASRLCELCGAPWDDDVDVGLRTARKDAIVMGDQVRAAWEDFLVASCAQAPVVLVVESLQWADGSSLALIDRALRNFDDRPFLVLGVARPEHRERHPKLWSERGVRELSLGPLKDRAAERLVRAVLGEDAEAARVERIVRRAAGNAYFLEELVRAEAEGLGDATPETVLVMVEARLLRLETELRRVLRAASVYGTRFDAKGVAAVLAPSSAVATVETLVRLEWLAPLPSGGYAFRQETSRDAAYAMLVDDDKALAHLRAAEWLAALEDPDAAAVAEHFERAGLPARAGEWWTKASERSLGANDFSAAIARSNAAERCGATGDDLCRALAVRAEAHGWRGESELQLAAAVAIHAASDGQPVWEAASLRFEAPPSLHLGRLSNLADVVRRVGDLASRELQLAAVTHAALWVSQFALKGGLTNEADALREMAERSPVLSMPHEILLQAVAADGRAQRAMFAQDSEAHVRGTRRAAELYAAAGDRRRAAQARANGGFGLIQLGANEEALEALSAALVECERSGSPQSVASAKQNIGLVLSRLGRHEDAEASERASIALAAKGGNRLLEAESRWYLSRILCTAGRADEAIAEAERAMSLLPPQHPYTFCLVAVRANALLARAGKGDAPAALADARSAREHLRSSTVALEEPAAILRTFLDALEANGLHDEAARERAEARAWVMARAERIASEHYRHTFLCGEPDNAAIVGHRP